MAMPIADEHDCSKGIDPMTFRNALGNFPTGVAIITTVGPDGEPVGLTCNSFSSVSLDPPLVSWGLRLNSKNLQAFQGASTFAINILAEDQPDLSSRFAKSGSSEKFAGVAWKTGHAGLPLIDDCVVRFECEKYAAHVAGDHVLFLGRVVRFEQVRQEDSLVFYKGAYMMVMESLRELAVSGRVDPADLHQARRLIMAMLVRLACANGREEDFDAIERNLVQIECHVAPAEAEQRARVSLAFFRLIAMASHNEVLMVVSDSLTTLLRHVVKATRSAETFRPELVPLRKRVLACLRARDSAGAEREMDVLLAQLSAAVPSTTS